MLSKPNKLDVPITLRHRVANDTIGPPAAVQLNSHADCALVVAVGIEANTAGEKGWIELLLSLQVGVDVGLDDLVKKNESSIFEV